MKYTLRKPFDFGKESVAELTFREAISGRDLKGIPAMPSLWQGEHVTLLASRLTGKPVSLLELLDSQDHFAILGLVSGFLFSSPAAGNEQSDT